MDSKKDIVEKLKKKPAVAEALERASAYYLEDVAPVRKEIKSLLLFLKKKNKENEAKTKLDLGFDTAFRIPTKDMQKLEELMIHNEQNRARATEMYVNLKKMFNRLDFLYKNTSDFIQVEYDGLISAMTKSAQSSLIDLVLESILEHRMEIGEMLDDLKAVTSTMDSTHWTLKSVKEIGEGIIERSTV